MGSRPAAGVSSLCALWLLVCTVLAAGVGARAAAPAAKLVPVLYPKGSCQTGWLEVQVYDASTERWRPHPQHPRVRAGECFRERSEILLTDLRVRCIDPSGRRAPSPWIQGTDLRGMAEPGRCTPPASGGAQRP